MKFLGIDPQTGLGRFMSDAGTEELVDLERSEFARQVVRDQYGRQGLRDSSLQKELPQEYVLPPNAAVPRPAGPTTQPNAARTTTPQTTFPNELVEPRFRPNGVPNRALAPHRDRR